MRTLSTLLLILTIQPVFASGQSNTLQPVNGLNAKEIVTRLAENNRKRQQDLQSYTAQREYHLLYTGLPGKREADLVVAVKYEAPGSKDFTVVSQSGSGFIVNRVFKKLLETEKEAADAQSQAKTAMNEDNYNFELLGREDLDGRPSYVLQVEPRTANKLLYRGKIWVDAADFAVARIEAEPAKRPSFWINKTVVHHTYRKIGDFWLPVQNESTSDVRLGGHAVLSIQYKDYKVVSETKSPGSMTPSEPAQPTASVTYQEK